jgi:WD40 repeat protein
MPGGDASVLTGASASFGLAGGPWAQWQEDDLPAGTDLGGVVIERLIARGGMGSVYQARQMAPDRAVAVKVVQAGRFGPGMLRRFADEARVLARLRHPHIAQIHACGTCPTSRGGLPFIVMELVEGARTITEHVAVTQAPLRDRVRLLRDVAAAVAHGHRKGVIHRDIKPGNILVDAAGTAKVIDFGVARTLDAAATGQERMTGSGDLVGTLRYMSPEQLGADADEVDARTDVYALGLVLHELLTGRLPYELRGASPVEAARILDGLTAPPTAELARIVRGAARLRADEARALAAIVAKCLEPRATDRYATAVEVEAELGRWLEGEPVLARPLTGFESLVRLARRHRIAAAAGGGMILSVLLAIAGITWFSLRAEGQRRQAVAARALAESRRAEADRQAADARAQLYLSTVLLAAEARDRDNLAAATRLLTTARGLVDAAGAGHPLELDCLAASLEDSVAVHRGQGRTITAVGWAPDGRWLVIGDTAGHVEVVAAGTADEGRALAAHEAAVWSVGFAPDGRLVATASADGTVRVHDTETWREVAVLDGHAGPVYGAAFAPNGSLLATASRDRKVRLWDTAGWSERSVLGGHEGTVYGVEFSPDGKLLVTGDQKGTARLWDVATATQLATIAGHEGRIFDVAFAADGGRLATVSEDGTARVWNVAGGTSIATMRHPFRVNSVAFLGDGGQVATASGDGVVRIWDADRGTEAARLRGHAGAVWSLAVVPGSSRIATGSADGTAREWDVACTIAGRARCDGRVLAAAFSPDGRTVAVGTAAETVQLCDSATYRPAGRFTTAAGRVNDVAFVPDNGAVAAACDDGAVRIWSPPDQEPTVIPLHARRIYSVGFSPTGRLMVTASEDRTARIWDVATGAAVAGPLRHPRRVFSATFSPDARIVATACEDDVARLWNVASGTEERRLTGHGAAVNWVAFDAEGARLATASSDGTVRLWRVADGRMLAELTGPARQVWKVAFSPDGSRVAAVSADGTAQLWDAATGRPAALLRGHRDQVWAVAFSPDGRSLVTGSWDGSLRAWGVTAAEIARRRAAATAP